MNAKSLAKREEIVATIFEKYGFQFGGDRMDSTALTEHLCDALPDFRDLAKVLNAYVALKKATAICEVLAAFIETGHLYADYDGPTTLDGQPTKLDSPTHYMFQWRNPDPTRMETWGHLIRGIGPRKFRVQDLYDFNWL